MSLTNFISTFFWWFSDSIFFFTVCDELLFGIPEKAWWVVVLVIICLCLALVIPYFLPTYLLQASRNPQSHNEIDSKDFWLHHRFSFHLTIKISIESGCYGWVASRFFFLNLRSSILVLDAIILDSCNWFCWFWL